MKEAQTKLQEKYFNIFIIITIMFCSVLLFSFSPRYLYSKCMSFLCICYVLLTCAMRICITVVCSMTANGYAALDIRYDRWSKHQNDNCHHKFSIFNFRFIYSRISCCFNKSLLIVIMILISKIDSTFSAKAVFKWLDISNYFRLNYWFALIIKIKKFF